MFYDEAFRSCLLVSRLITESGFAPRCNGRRTAYRGFAFTAAVRVIARVHDGTAHRRANALVARLTGFAELDAYEAGPFAYFAPVSFGACVSAQNLTVDGATKNVEKYNILGSNYFKLRDIAMLLSGTPAQFDVSFDEETRMVSVTTGKAYTPVGGELETVILRCKNEMSNVIVDQFGKDITMVPVDDDHFTVRVEVAVSDQFFGWVIGLGDGVRIDGPEKAVNRMKEIGKQLTKTY